MLKKGEGVPFIPRSSGSVGPAVLTGQSVDALASAVRENTEAIRLLAERLRPPVGWERFSTDFAQTKKRFAAASFAAQEAVESKEDHRENLLRGWDEVNLTVLAYHSRTDMPGSVREWNEMLSRLDAGPNHDRALALAIKDLQRQMGVL